MSGRRDRRVEPRRILLDPFGWQLLRDAAAADGIDAAAVPELKPPRGDPGAAREELVANGLLRADGGLAGWVRAGLAVLGAGAVTVRAERMSATGRVVGHWSTIGAPTAGLVVFDRYASGQARAGRRVELQLLEVDDLVGVVVDTLALPEHVRSDVGPAHAVDVGVATPADGLPAPLAGVVVDGEVATRASVDVVGPRGAQVAMLVGDGSQWWQTAAVAPDTVRWTPVDGASVASSVTAALAGQLAALADAGGVAA